MLFTVNSFYYLRNPEFLQQGKDLMQIIADADPKSLEIEKGICPFAADIKAIEDVFKKAKSSPLTQTLVNLDDKRDRVFFGMCLIIDGNKKCWLPNIVSAANLLSDSIDVYGRNLVRFNYQAESANLTNLIDTLESDTELSAALVTLHLDIWKDELKATNNLFITTYTDRAKEEGANNTILSIKELRDKALTNWGKLENLLIGKVEEYEADTTKAPLYNTLINSINGVLDDYNNLLAQREGRKAVKAANTKDVQ